MLQFRRTRCPERSIGGLQVDEEIVPGAEIWSEGAKWLTMVIIVGIPEGMSRESVCLESNIGSGKCGFGGRFPLIDNAAVDDSQHRPALESPVPERRVPAFRR